ncbi:MAG: hypothetical protein Q7S34_01285 [bacterium]|nr:hypothetical protein [bacterium]
MPKTMIDWCPDPKELYRLTVFVQNDIDPPEGTATAAYLFGHTKFYESPILSVGASLIKSGKTERLYLCKLAPGYPYNGTADDPTYPDFERWQEKLNMLLIPREDIHPIVSPIPKLSDEKFPISNTATEAYLLIKLAKNSGWKSVYVVTHPIHVLRAFTCAVSFAIRYYPELRIYAKSGYPINSWVQSTIANQGVVSGTRLDGAMDGEYERLNTRWDNEYDHVMAKEMLEYVRRRDSIVCTHPNCPAPHDARHYH